MEKGIFSQEIFEHKILHSDWNISTNALFYTYVFLGYPTL